MSARAALAPLLMTAFVALASACSGGGSGTATSGGPYDVIIENGRIVDGTGAPWFYGDIAIEGARIARMTPRGMLHDASARHRIDATGRVVAPGFIDILGQSYNAFLFGDGRDVSKVTQGVTTEILGEGGTPAPANAKTRAGSSPPSDTARARILKSFEGPHGFDAWLRAMHAHGTSVNVGSFLGAATVRQYAKGMQIGAPTPAELDTMRAVVRRAMRDGAFGLGSALIYPPGSYATTGELIAEAQAMAPYGGVYITHMRSEGNDLLHATHEAIRIGAEGGVPVEIYHLKAAGRSNWPKEAALIALIDSARAAGIDVQADMYPYTGGETGLTACLPPSSAEGGKLFERLSDPAARAKIKAEVLHPTSDWENLCTLSTPAGVMLIGLKKPTDQKWIGKRLSQVADAMGEDWIDAAMDLIASDSTRVETIYFLASEENVRWQLQQPWIKIGTDAAGMDPDSVHGEMAHPRAYGTYPRILGRYVREDSVIGLEDAIRKMTSAVADRLRLTDRGVLRPGMYADIVVFDPATIIDRATYQQPHQLSTGVEEVFVNGVEVVRDGVHTGAKPGRIVRGPGWRG